MKKVFLLVWVLLMIPTISFSYFITIDTVQKKVPPVYFDHSYHLDKENGLGFECNACHHELKSPEQMPVRCTKCHFPKELIPDTKKDLPLDIKEAYHTKCRGCHQNNRKKYKGAPTSDCGACHKKELNGFVKERIRKDFENSKKVLEKDAVK